MKLKKPSSNLAILSYFKRAKCQFGFSLFELLAVIGIISILSGGVLYSFSKLQKNSDLEKSITDIRSLLSQGRENVRKGNCQKRIFDFDALSTPKKVSSYCYNKNNPNDTTEDFKVVIPSDITMVMNQNADFKKIQFVLINSGLGGLSVKKLQAEDNFDFDKDFSLILKKDTEQQKIDLNQKTILYGPY